MAASTCIATAVERRRPLPVDAIVADPIFTSTHAITIDAPPEEVWPWIAQMGAGRAGWYSWDVIDNGGDASSTSIRPAFQAVARGDVMPAIPGARDAFVVAAVDPPRDLVLTVPDGHGGNAVGWEHVLDPLGDGRTRLIVRGRASSRWLDLARRRPPAGHRRILIEHGYAALAKLPRPLVVAFAAVGHRIMEARHLRGIQRRSTASRHDGGPVERFRPALLMCGTLASLMFIAMTLFVGMLWEGYSAASHTISELSAIGAPTRPLWLLLSTVYTVLMVAFGWIVWKTATSNRALRMVGLLVMAQGVFAYFWPPMHQRAVLAAGGSSLTDTLHIVWTMVTGLFFTLATGFGAAAFGKRFRLYSIATMVIMLACGALTGTYASRVEADLPTPGVGVVERISTAAYMLWVAVLATTLLRTKPSKERRIMSRSSAFKSAFGESKYLAAYDDALKRWPVAYEELDVPTRFGTTHVVAAGPKNAPALVLLHGYMATSVMWAPNIADFIRTYRVYAIDVMGQPGKSVPDQPIRHVTDYVAWLTATLDGLNLTRVSLGGMSFGGSIALRYAAAAPERVQRLALLSPGGLLPMVKQFTLRGMLMVFLPTRFTVNSFMHWAGVTGAEARPLLHLMYLGVKHFRMPKDAVRADRDAASPLSDDDLRSLRMPVLLLFGDGEVIYDSAEALARARRLIPQFEGELIPRCRHEMVFSQSRIVDARVLDFLKRTGGPQAETEGRSVA